jgi:tripartite-type tricarboxylate transporter receptor subunit TctC
LRTAPPSRKDPARTVPEFIAYAKANAGKLNMASVGIGTLPHVTDLLGGQVQVYWQHQGGARKHVRSGGRFPSHDTRVACSLLSYGQQPH